MSGPTAAASESTSFSCAKRTAGASGSNAARLAGWPVAGERAVRAAVEGVLERDHDRLPVALRAHFSAASIASAPELQKKERAPPKRSESSSASRSIGSVE